MSPVCTEAQDDGATMSVEVLTIKEVVMLRKLAEKTVYVKTNTGKLTAFMIRRQRGLSGSSWKGGSTSR